MVENSSIAQHLRFRIAVRTFILVALMCQWVVNIAQDSSYVFPINATEAKIHVFPNDTVLLLGMNNPIQIALEGEGKIVGVKLIGGSIVRKDDYYIARVDSGEQAVLNVYYKGIDNRNHLGMSRHYSVFEMPKPQPLVCGIQPNQASNTADIIRRNNIVVHWAYPADMILPVLSFDMRYYNKQNKRFETLHSDNDRLTRLMISAISRRNDGDVLLFENITYMMPDKQIQQGQATIYVID